MTPDSGNLFWLDELFCKGDEDTLGECKHNILGVIFLFYLYLESWLSKGWMYFLTMYNTDIRTKRWPVYLMVEN